PILRSYCTLRPVGAATFPYPTLFRSRGGEKPVSACRVGAGQISSPAPPQYAPRRGGFANPPGNRPPATLMGERKTGGVRVALRPDRKSTRLNSSHVKISYAVFCLKKT